MMQKTVLVVAISTVGGVRALTAPLTAAALKDQITNLPGIPASAKNMTQFSGYIPVDSKSTKEIFYWLVESLGKPETDPIVLWTNGGPGCSGLAGLLTELGPFRPNAEGTLDMNPDTWNKVANIVYIEQPAGVGFSTAPSGTAYGDEMAANDNYAFIMGFLEKFPQYKDRDFYLTSESYGGHYLPTLAKVIVDNGGVSLKGFAVGNPLTWMPDRNFGEFGTLYYHQQVPKPLFESYMAAGCDKDDSSETCQDIENTMMNITADLDPYALDFPICTDSAKKAGRMERHAMSSTIARANARRLEQATGLSSNGRKLASYWPDNYNACTDNYAGVYLNRKDVQTAIHAQVGTNWQECNMDINSNYNIDDVNAPMMPIYQALLANTTANLNIMVYSGDDDSVCATLGSQQWIYGLNSPVVDAWAPWSMDGQTTGYHVSFENRLHFTTVHGAGHMVPATRPSQALELFTKYLAGDW